MFIIGKVIVINKKEHMKKEKTNTSIKADLPQKTKQDSLLPPSQPIRPPFTSIYNLKNLILGHFLPKKTKTKSFLKKLQNL